MYKNNDIDYAQPEKAATKYVIITLFGTPFKHKAKNIY